MDEAKRTVDHTPQDFLAVWWRGEAGPVPCAGCSACCYYAGIPVDKKRDQSRLPYLLTKRKASGAARSTSSGHRPVATSTAARSQPWA